MYVGAMPSIIQLVLGALILVGLINGKKKVTTYMFVMNKMKPTLHATLSKFAFRFLPIKPIKHH